MGFDSLPPWFLDEAVSDGLGTNDLGIAGRIRLNSFLTALNSASSTMTHSQLGSLSYSTISLKLGLSTGTLFYIATG